MQLIVTKQAGDRQLAHLYEHIFLNALSDELRSGGYLSFLDYDVSGIVDKNGLIVLDLKFKDYLETKIKNFLATKRLALFDDVIAGAALQIFAEKSVDSDGFDNKTIGALKQLDFQKWKEADRLGTNSKKLVTDDGFLNLHRIDKVNFFRDKIEFKFLVRGATNLRHLALFYYLSRILVNSSSEIIENDFYAYCTEVVDGFRSDRYIASVEL